MPTVRPDDDFYETPEYATLSLAENVKFEGRIWEPACGYGAISRVLKDYGYEVYSSDITYRNYGWGALDFLSDHKIKYENIITNPPFKLAEQFVYKALECTTNKVALLLRLAFLESQSRKNMFQETPLENVYVFSKRLTMYPANFNNPKSSGGTMAFAWFIWNHSYKGEPILRWI